MSTKKETSEPIAEKVATVKKVELSFFKGYDIQWLSHEDQINHPHRYLVNQYNRKLGKEE